jgi:hypothetical protein
MLDKKKELEKMNGLHLSSKFELLKRAELKICFEDYSNALIDVDKILAEDPSFERAIEMKELILKKDVSLSDNTKSYNKPSEIKSSKTDFFGRKIMSK